MSNDFDNIMLAFLMTTLQLMSIMLLMLPPSEELVPTHLDRQTSPLQQDRLQEILLLFLERSRTFLVSSANEFAL